jgi:photosystem II stability/assembly factor-like uncharacterized protein
METKKLKAEFNCIEKYYKVVIYNLVLLIVCLSSGCVEDQSENIYTFKDFAGWKNQSSGVNKSLNAIYFVNKQQGWVVGKDGIILHSTDGGITWRKQNSHTDEMLNSVYFLDENIGWVAGGSIRNGKMRSPYLAKTMDGGSDWVKINIPYSQAILTDILFTDSLSGWLSGYTRDSTFLLYSSDAGAFWIRKYGDISDKKILDIESIDKYNIWVAGENILIFTSDGGESWNRFIPTSDIVLTSIDFVNYDYGWLVGWGGMIQRYNSSSDTLKWYPQVAPVISDFYDVRFINSSRGWVVGGKGTVLFTVNGGNNWDYLESGVTQSFFKVFFVDELNGWLIGERGMIFRTTTGGINP